MAQAEDHIHRSPEEELFYEYLKNGDDFSKIEIYRLAKFWYQKAIETGIQPELLANRIEELNIKIAFERKVISILATIAAAIVVVVFMTRI